MNHKIGAVILAAGISDLSKTEMLKSELDTLREFGISPVAVVTGHRDEEIRKELVHRRVIFVDNPDYRTTKMFTSIQLGVKAIDCLCEKAVIVNSDSPMFSGKTLAAITETEYDITFPVYDGRPGHPFCIHMDAKDAILSYGEDDGIRGMLEKGLLSAGFVDVEDPGIHMEAKEEDSLREIIKYRQDAILSEPIDAEIGVSIRRGDVFFDEELEGLLIQIDRCHSLNTACKNLDMAYSRGWKMLKKAEERLSCPLIAKQVGGQGGGGSALTEEGKKYLSAYGVFRRRITEFAESEIRKFF